MTTSRTTLSVVIPVYLGACIIHELTLRLSNVLASLVGDYEIILVNDASPDDSWEKIKEAVENDRRIKGICLAGNIGQHPATSTGLLHARGDWVVVMDCDLQDLPEDLPKLWEKAQQGVDIAMARRTERKDSLLRRTVSRAFYHILSWKRGIRIDPDIANYAIYRRTVIEQYKQDYNLHGVVFSVLNYIKRYSFAAVNVTHGVSGLQKSNYTMAKRFALAFQLLFPSKKRIATEEPLFKIRHLYGIGIEKYDVRLVRITVEDIEKIRQWRNSPEVATYMHFREYITPEKQKEWFTATDNEFHSYTLIEYQGKQIGLANLKAIDYVGKTAEAGMFISDPDYLNTDIPVRSTLCGLDYIFEVSRLEQVTAHVLASNKRAIRFNLATGYELLPGQEGVENQLYRLTKKKYYEHRALLLDLLGEDS